MNNKGFTLIELLVTIALLAIIAIISFVSVNGIIRKSKVNDCEILVSNIESATKDYVSDNRYKNLDVGNFTAQKLVDGKYLSSPIVNPFDTDSIIEPSSIKINVTLNSDYTVKKVSISAPAVLKECKSE